MGTTNLVKGLAFVILLVLAAGIWQTRDTWKPWIIRDDSAAGDTKKDAHSDEPERVKLSPQAQKNLRLIVKQVRPTTYLRKIYLPGTVIDRPGHSDRGISAPMSGVITQVMAVPGKSVHAGQPLFRLRLVSETLQTSQMELFKSTRELEIVQKERKRLAGIPAGAVPSTRFLELEYQKDRLGVLIEAYQQDLATRQLDAKQIAEIAKGKFVTEVVIRMPERLHDHGLDAPKDMAVQSTRPVEFEVQELKVHPGDHVKSGQILAYVADHRFLYIEGRALKQEIRVLARAAKENWPVEAEFAEENDHAPIEQLSGLTIEFLGTTMDATGLTLAIYIPFANPQKTYLRNKVTYRTGQYRPGQKVLLKVAVSKMDDVYVLPIAAVARDGPEAYVFRQNGDSFCRSAVHVLHEDADVVVVEDDGGIVPGTYLAHNAAAALNRALKAAQSSGEGGHHHDH